jgi:hypothetical protein
MRRSNNCRPKQESNRQQCYQQQQQHRTKVRSRYKAAAEMAATTTTTWWPIIAPHPSSQPIGLQHVSGRRHGGSVADVTRVEEEVLVPNASLIHYRTRRRNIYAGQDGCADPKAKHEPEPTGTAGDYVTGHAARAD